MAATITPVLLSGSTSGRGIKVTQTSTPGDTVHQTGTSSTDEDRLDLFAMNVDTIVVDVTLEWGGVTAPDDNIKTPIPPGAGLFPVALGLPLRGDGSALTIKAFASVANKIILFGCVNRYTP